MAKKYCSFWKRYRGYVCWSCVIDCINRLLICLGRGSHRELSSSTNFEGSRHGAVVRALVSHKCGQGSIPRICVTFGLSLLVLYSALRGTSPGILVFPPHKTNLRLSRSELISVQCHSTKYGYFMKRSPYL